jgi:hypothetical protein
MGFRLAVVVLLAISALSCSSPGQPRLQFVGDSITALSAREIHARFDPRYDVGIHAFVGITTAGMLDASRQAASASPKVAIVNLGTNDISCTGRYLTCNGAYSPAQTEANLRKIDATFPSSTCVIFVDLNTHVLYPHQAEDLNRFIHATFPHVVPWAAAYRRSWFTSDVDPHPNAAGRQELVRLQDQAIARC